MSSSLLTALAAVAVLATGVQGFVSGVNPNKIPHQSERGQYGFNDCSSKTLSATSKCQTIWLNSAQDFCLFSSPKAGETVGEIERIAVAYCTKNTHGSRLIPKGTLRSVHFVKTPNYIQITGTGDFTKLKIKRGDEGGELDPHGADGLGNPIGGLVFTNARGKAEQLPEWTSFMSDSEYCIRGCFGETNDARRYCEHIYDVMGCQWNIPGNYGKGFDQCSGANVVLPMGEYRLKNGQISTWYQGVKPTPAGQKPAKTSACKKIPSPTAAPYKKAKRDLSDSDDASSDLESRDVPAPAPVQKKRAGHSKRAKRAVQI